LASLHTNMEERLNNERIGLEAAVLKEKEEKDRLALEVAKEKEMRDAEVRKQEEELESERASHAAQLEMIREEKEQREADLKQRLEELEKKKEEMQKEIEVERARKAASDEECKTSAAQIATLEQEMEKVNKNLSESKKGTTANEFLSKMEETLESQYQCPTCLELFISPVALNCGHTYCWLCLAQWKGSSGRTRGDLGTCPTCRVVVQHENRVYAIDHMIDAIVDQLGDEKKKERQEKLQERKEAEEDFKKTATIAAVNTANRGRGRGSVAERGRNASNRGRQSVGRNITVNAFRRSERAIEISSSDDSEEE